MVSRKSPPRWFAPALFGAMLLAVAGLTALVAWLYDPPNAAVRIGARAYVVPPSALSSLTPGPPAFVRIRPPGKAFEIVHDARAAGRRDPAGMPHIFSVNDNGPHEIRYDRKGRYLIACRRAGAPFGGCGTWIDHDGTTWSVLFPESRIADAEKFAREATLLLRKYDTRPSGLLP